MAMTELQRLRINVRNVLRRHDASSALMADIDRVFGIKMGEVKPTLKISHHRVNKISVATQGMLEKAMGKPWAVKRVDIPFRKDRTYRLIVLKYRDRPLYEDSVILESPPEFYSGEIKLAISKEGLAEVLDSQRFGISWKMRDLVYLPVDINQLPGGFHLYVHGPNREPFRFTQAMIVGGY